MVLAMVLVGLGSGPNRSGLWSWQVWAVVLAGLGCGPGRYGLWS